MVLFSVMLPTVTPPVPIVIRLAVEGNELPKTGLGSATGVMTVVLVPKIALSPEVQVVSPGMFGSYQRFPVVAHPIPE